MVLDLFSRKAVGWAIDRRCEAALVNDALAKASTSRPTSPSTVIRSDHGSQPRLKGSSQRGLVKRSVEAHRGPPPVSSSRGSCGAAC